jgi:hypothetical protein
MTRLQRVQIGKEVLYAAAMILMKDRDATLDALSKGVTMEATIEVINFTSTGSRRKTMTGIAALRKEGFELLAVVLPDGVCKYSLGNPQHLACASVLLFRRLTPVPRQGSKRQFNEHDRAAWSVLEADVLVLHLAKIPFSRSWANPR